jgi:hypothetical protein
MLVNVQRFRAGFVSTILSFLPMLMLIISAIVCAIVMVRPTLAQNGASQTAPPSQTGTGSYWTPERMREAQPAMPTVPGTPQSGSSTSTSGPSNPSGGAPGQEPQVQPNRGNR